MLLGTWLEQATKTLTDQDISSARLDAQLLATHGLGRERTWLLSHGDYVLDPSEMATLETLLSRRLQHEPLAYITGRRAFHGRDFIVSSAVLIPRPETEALIDELKQLQPTSLLDVGTGSGAIAVTTALELPKTEVSACDISPAALEIACQNAQNLGATVHFFTSDLLAAAKGQFQAIAANLPYVDEAWERSPETAHEPSLALFAADHGLELIKKLIVQTPEHLQQRGYLLLEADPVQHQAISAFAKNYHLSQVAVRDYLVVLQLTD